MEPSGSPKPSSFTLNFAFMGYFISAYVLTLLTWEMVLKIFFSLKHNLPNFATTFWSFRVVLCTAGLLITTTWPQCNFDSHYCTKVVLYLTLLVFLCILQSLKHFFFPSPGNLWWLQQLSLYLLSRKVPMQALRPAPLWHLHLYNIFCDKCSRDNKKKKENDCGSDRFICNYYHILNVLTSSL